MKKILIGLVAFLLSTSSFAYQYTCQFIVGFPAGSGDSQVYDFDSTSPDALSIPFNDYVFTVATVPITGGTETQVRITDPFGGMSTADFQDGYRNPFVASRHDASYSAAQIKCKLK